MSDSVVLSNGFGQFHLARLAQKLAEQEMLELFITAGYLKASQSVLSRVIGRAGTAASTRLSQRSLAIPDEKVASIWPPELPHQVAQRLRSAGRSSAADRLTAMALDGYARRATTLLPRAADVYHVRAGYGGRSIAAARSNGAVVVCDHSIAHPSLLQGLISGTGELTRKFDSLWSRVDADMTASDLVIVNSDFVAATCRDAGMNPDRIHVAYTAIDADFLDVIDQQATDASKSQNRYLFAGTLEARKGIDVFVEAARLMGVRAGAKWEIVGSWQPDSVKLRSNLPNDVTWREKLPRNELAALLASRPVLIFPTRAEGSARIVAEALAAGCFVITTPNAGSVVRDGVDGFLVPPNDVGAVVDAITRYELMTAGEVAKRGDATKAFARTRLTEENYLNDVLSGYERARSLRARK